MTQMSKHSLANEVMTMTQSHKNEPDKQTPFILYYFPSMQNMDGKFFGHVAVGDNHPHLKNQSSFYLSYGIAEKETKDKTGKLQERDNYRKVNEDKSPTAHFQEERIYGIPIRIFLQANAANLMQARINFGELDRNNYSVTANNCAHAVLNFLHNAGVTSLKKMIDPTPQAVAAHACEILMKKIESARKEIIKDKYASGIGKIHQLLANDLARLETRLQLDLIQHVSGLIKDPEIKNDKIKILKKLKNEFEAVDSNYQQKLDALLTAKKSMPTETFLTFNKKNQTAAHLQECIDCFPYELLPNMKEKRGFLKGLENAIKEKNTSGTYENTKGLNKILMPEKNLDKISDKEVYLLFEMVNKQLNTVINNTKNPEIKTFCEIYKGIGDIVARGMEVNHGQRIAPS